jgi:2'-5' RNA ligase
VARLFVAVWPPDDVLEPLRALGRKDRRGVRFVRPDNWHVTLRFLGEADPAIVASALDQALLPTVHARLGPAVDVLAERALVVPVTGIDALAAAVEAATSDLGQPPRKRFVGHLTLARLHRRATMPEALGALVGGAFDVTEIALVQSRLHPDGARYETLATWPTGRPYGG